MDKKKRNTFKKGTMPVDGLNYANEVKKRIYSE